MTAAGPVPTATVAPLGRPVAAAWAGLVIGAAMVVAPLAPGPSAEPAGVGTVPATVRVLAPGPRDPGRDLSPGTLPGALPPGDPSAGAPPAAVPRSAVPPAAAPRRAGAPVRLQVAALGVDATVVPVDGAADGGLTVPPDPSVVGWWRAGAAPGSAAGTVLLAGHVDTVTAGPGALFHLAALGPGDRVVLGTGSGPTAYVVAAVRYYPKAQLPADVFDTTGAPRLVLVTCGGAFDRRTRHYADNVVVYAVPQS